MNLCVIAGLISNIAVASPEVASAIAKAIKDELAKKGGFNFGYDVSDIGVSGQSEDHISFPARPVSFDKENLNGTIHVKFDLEPPIPVGAISLNNVETSAEAEVGFYFKTPKLPGGGKYMFPTDAGKIDIIFDEETPLLVDPSQIDKLASKINELAEKIIEEPPIGARSHSRDPDRRRQLQEMAEQARAEQKKQEEKEKALELISEKESTAKFYEKTHGSPEIFGDYMDSIEEEIFGPQDVQKILDTMYPTSSAAQKAMMRNEVINKLKEEGFEWSVQKTELSSIARKICFNCI
jgi:hypothetical protein